MKYLIQRYVNVNIYIMLLETHFRDAFIFGDKLNNDIHRNLVFNEY